MRAIDAIGVLGLVGIAACGTATDTTPATLCATNDAPTYELGASDGTQPFRSLADDAMFQLSRGPQGGCHLALAFRTTGFDGMQARIGYRLTVVDTGEVINDMMATADLDATMLGPTTCELTNFRAFMGFKAWEADGKRVRIDTAITDFRNKSATKSVTVLVTWPDEAPNADRDTLCGPRG